jgi:NAD-dependent protein deacetylase/lipoamidase
MAEAVQAQPGASPQSRQELIARLRTAQRVVVFTGAGVSAESGIPTFRDTQSGLWEKFDAMELATPAAFRKDPGLVWGWYEWRRAAVLQACPNGAHQAIARMAHHVPELTVITQNVDDLHERAGSARVLHLHGRLAHPYCESCRRPHAFRESTEPAMPDVGRRLEPPRCGACGGRIRPGVVWFGESLPAEEWEASINAARRAEVFFCIGTSSLVQPAASLTELAMRAGAVTVQINPNPTGLEDAVNFAYMGLAGAVLPQLVSDTWLSRFSATAAP